MEWFELEKLGSVLNNIHENDEGCWVWSGAYTWDGYPRLYENRRSKLAHRFIHFTIEGIDDDGCYMKRRCSNPKCVNPHHFEIRPRVTPASAKVRRNKSDREILNDFFSENPNHLNADEFAKKHGKSLHDIIRIVSGKKKKLI